MVPEENTASTAAASVLLHMWDRAECKRWVKKLCSSNSTSDWFGVHEKGAFFKLQLPGLWRMQSTTSSLDTTSARRDQTCQQRTDKAVWRSHIAFPAFRVLATEQLCIMRGLKASMIGAVIIA